MSFSDDFSQILNQTVTWSKKTGQDKYNNPTYTDTDIDARKERRNRMARSTTGELVVSSTTVFTQSAIGLEDEIDGEKVIDVMDMVDGDGDVIGYEVLL